MSGKRADLKRLREPDALLGLTVEGPGIGSLAGIERCVQLERLILSRVRGGNLFVLEQLPRLRELTLDKPRAPTDLRALERLSALRYLRVEVDEPLAPQLGALNLSGLTQLRRLFLVTKAGARQPLDLSWVDALQRLERLAVDGFVVTNDDLQRLNALPVLGRALLPARSPAQGRWARTTLGHQIEVREDAQVLDRIHDHTATGDSEPYSLGIDLAEQWELETNVEAEQRLRRLLDEHAPALARRVSFDTESGAVWLVAAQREDLVAVQDLIKGQQGS